ncbi:MAG: type II toxin-antitoxin system RelE/ParE family toxin [Bacteroidota bacterium]
MEIKIDRSFEKDVKKIRLPKIRKQIAEKIEEVADLNDLQELKGVKKIKGFEGYYRIRLGEYRIGFEVDGNAVIFLRVLHRKDIYKFFP